MLPALPVASANSRHAEEINISVITPASTPNIIENDDDSDNNGDNNYDDDYDDDDMMMLILILRRC